MLFFIIDILIYVLNLKNSVLIDSGFLCPTLVVILGSTVQPGHDKTVQLTVHIV